MDSSQQLTDVLKTLGDFSTRLGFIDIGLVLMVLVGLLWGYRKGFSVFFNRFIQMVVMIIITLEYFDATVGLFSIESSILKFLARITFFLLIAFTAYFFTRMIMQAAAKILTINFAELIDKLGGAIFGASFFVLLISFFSYFLLLFPGEFMKTSYEKYNLSGSFLLKLCPDVHQLIRPVIPDAIKAYATPESQTKKPK